MEFWLVDAFTDKRFAGNPAGVVLVSNFPSVELMQNIAMELNISQTTFVKQLDDDLYHIRWFTPNSEAPLCGHATIAAVHILLQKNKGKKFIFQSISGDLLASVDEEWINLNFPSYETNPVNINQELMSIINEIPIYTGFSENCFLMEFKNTTQIKNLKPDLRLLTNLPCRALIVTAKADEDEFMEYDFVSRYFAPKVGIDEDPVCGSSHCRLIPYWSKKLQKKQMKAYQLSKRGGVIKCMDMGNRVQISGQAVTIAQGRFFL